MPSTNHRIGISLSGGGYRATAFHLGTLNKLHELKVLEKASVISTISGGSITGAYYCLHKDDFDTFKKNLYDKIHTKNVIKKVLLSWTFLQLLLVIAIFLVPAFYFLLTSPAWLFPVLFVALLIVLFKFQFLIFPVSTRIEKIYDQFFYDNKKLADLPPSPVLVIGATNLQTARAFTFSRNWMQDSTYQYMLPRITFEAGEFPVARAVMASSCVPFAFTPIKIDRKFFTDASQAKLVHPVLVDGGVYDNQGIHKIVQRGQYACEIVITSDAGAGSAKEKKFRNTLSLLLQTVDVFMLRIKKSQMAQDVFGNAGTANKEIAYLSLGWDVEECIPGFVRNLQQKQITQQVIEAHHLLAEWVADPERHRDAIISYLEKRIGYRDIDRPTVEEKKLARSVGTNLTSLSKRKLDALIKQAEALTEVQVKLYCPSLIN